MSKIEAVLLDLDGTCLDEDEANKRAYLMAGDMVKQKYNLNPNFVASRAHELIKAYWKTSIGRPYGEILGLGSTDGVSSEFSVPNKYVDVQKLNSFGAILRYRVWLKILQEAECRDEVLAQEIALSFADLRRQSFKPCPGVFEALSVLGKDYSLAIVTNGVNNIQMAKIKACGLDRDTDTCVVSESIQHRKPSQVMFNTAIKRLGVKGEAAVMVGDSLINDIDGAQKAGIGYSVWIRDKNVSNLDGVQPYLTIDSLAELPSHILDLGDIKGRLAHN